MNERTSSNRQTMVVCLALAAATLVVFWPVLQHAFINLDDPEYITQNAHILKGWSWDNVAWAFTTGYAANWHPLTWLSHMLDVQWFGLEAGQHHLISALLHALNAAACFLAVKKLTGTFWRSACVAALFALHPLHVESVAWASERKDVLSAFFFFLTLWSYAAYVEAATPETDSAMPGSEVSGRKKLFYALSLGSLALGLMSKPMLVTAPCLLLLLDFWPLARFDFVSARPKAKVLLLEKAPFFVLAVASSIVTYLVQDRSKAVGPVAALGLEARAANAVLSTFKYLAKTFWPADLSVFYPHPYLHYPNGDPVITSHVVIAFAVLLVVTVGACVRHKTQPYLFAGWFWFLGMLVPVIGLVQVGSQGMADRYTYLPLIGVFICFVWAVSDFVADRNLPKPVLATVGGLVVIVCTCLTWKQVSYWQDDVTLFEHALAVTKMNPQAHFNLATGLGRQRKYDEAIEHLSAALKIMPNYTEAQYDLGLAYMSQGDLPRAAQEYEKAVRLQPTYIPARNNLGAVLLAMGKPQEALEQYAALEKLQPGSPVIAFNQGRALLALRRFAEAAEQLGAAARSCPTDVDVQVALGNALFESGRTNEAAVAFAEAQRLDPALPQKVLAGGKTLLSQGRTDLAQTQFELFARLERDNPEAYQQAGLLLAEQGKAAEAMPFFERCVALRPDAQSYYNLGLACVMAAQSGRAVTNYQAAIKLNPDWAVALNDLAWLLATAGDPAVRDGGEAVRLAERACDLSSQKEARYLGTLDAAYAEAGRFDDAVATAEKARRLAEASGQTELAKAALERIEHYKKHEAFHQN